MERELILAALKKAGLSEDLFDQITATNEDELATQIEELQKKHQKPSLAELLKEAGLNESLEEQIKATVGEMIQSETDRRVTSAIEKVTKKMSKGTGNEGDNSQIAELNKKLDTLTEAMTGQQKKAEQDRFKLIAGQELEKRGLPKKWLGRITVEKEDEIVTTIDELEKEFKEIKQSTIDEVLKQNPIPGFSLNDGGTGTQKARIDKFVDNLKTEQTQTKVASLEPNNSD